MRQAFETAPRDGKVVILEDDASGTYDVAHWSAEAGEWVGEDGEPSKITPTHWYPYSFFPFSSSRAPPQRSAASDVIAPRSVAAAPVAVEAFEASTALVEANPTPHARPRFAASSITATLIAAALIGLYFRAEVAAYVTRYTGQQDIFGISMMGGQVAEQAAQLPGDSEASSLSRDIALQQRTETDRATAQADAQVKQAVEATAPQARQSSEKEQRPEVLASELAEARRAINGLNQQLRAGAANSAQLLGQERDKAAALLQDATAARQELAASTAQHRQALEEKRARSAALASELAMARREIETQAALLRKAGGEAVQLKQAGDEAVQLKQAAENELRQSLQQERDRTESARSAALASELAMARREIETQAALLRKADDEAVQLKRAAENAMRELRQSLQQERDRTEAMARDLEAVRRTIDGRVALERTANSQSAPVTQAVEAAASEQPAAAVSQGGREVARLMARASALLGQGNIGAARIVLERAAETGSAKASFALAETYDPVILSAWGTYGTRGDATKARELYAKAHAGGIQEAKDRFNALR